MKVYIVKKTFGDKVVLQNFYGEFPKGKTIALTGKSGEGKTTVLRILCGLDRDYSGAFEDRPVEPVMLFQEDRLVESISVLSNLTAVNPDQEVALELLSAIGLGAEAHSKVSELSGGMKRRVAIVRMLLLEADLYLLDEPFTGLDRDAKIEAAKLIRKCTEGTTVVVVSHDEEDLELLGVTQRIKVGNNG